MRLKGNIWNIPLKDLLTDFDSIFLTCPLIKNKNDIFKGKKFLLCPILEKGIGRDKMYHMESSNMVFCLFDFQS